MSLFYYIIKMILTILLLVLTVTIVLIIVLLTLSAEVKLPKISLNEDGKFVDSTGNEVILRGVNISHKMYPYTYGDVFLTPISEHINYIKSNLGFNSIRLAICWDAIEPTPGNYNDNYINSIFGTVNFFQKFGIYTLFSFQTNAYAINSGGWGNPNWSIMNPNDTVSDIGFPGILFGGAQDGEGGTISLTLSNTVDLFWANTPYLGTGIRDRYYDMVLYFLGRIKNNSLIRDAIQGIDFQNEPWPGTRWIEALATADRPPPVPDLFGDYYEWSAAGTVVLDTDILEPHYKDFIEKYREKFSGKDFIIYFQPFLIFGSGCPANLNFNNILTNVSDTQVVFNFHNYAEQSSVCFNNAQTVLSSYTKSNNNILGIYMSEFGADPTTAGWGADIIELTDQGRYSYNYWVYLQKLDFFFSEGSPPYPSQSIYTNPEIPFDSQYINENISQGLSTPYPKSVPGEITSYGLNTDDNFEVLFQLKNFNSLRISVPYRYFSNNSYNVEIYKNSILEKNLSNIRQTDLSISLFYISLNDNVNVILVK